ncbi:hypothetical protein BR93DRAFT_973084 [Coniochaeta sp. PMI_546]|nr:hypothetical protein BR93DRAFT_973084 [Coniochaeta sp. PMI_546]
MNFCTSFACDGPSYESSNLTDFSLDDWSTLAQEDALSDFNMPDSPGVTSPGSVTSSQWTEGCSDIFGQLEIDIELRSGIMDDYDGVDVSAICGQPNMVDVKDNMSLSPQLLSRTTPAMVATPPVLRSADAAPNTLHLLQTGDTAIVNTSTPVVPSTCSTGDQPRRGRGRRKLPEEKLKKNLRRKLLPEKCIFCADGFEWKKELKRHLRTYHKQDALDAGCLNEDDVQRRPCPYCVQTFARPDYLTRHLKNKHAWSAQDSSGS